MAPLKQCKACKLHLSGKDEILCGDGQTPKVECAAQFPTLLEE